MTDLALQIGATKLVVSVVLAGLAWPGLCSAVCDGPLCRMRSGS